MYFVEVQKTKFFIGAIILPVIQFAILFFDCFVFLILITCFSVSFLFLPFFQLGLDSELPYFCLMNYDLIPLSPNLCTLVLKNFSFITTDLLYTYIQLGYMLVLSNSTKHYILKFFLTVCASFYSVGFFVSTFSSPGHPPGFHKPYLSVKLVSELQSENRMRLQKANRSGLCQNYVLAPALLMINSVIQPLKVSSSSSLQWA